MPDRQAQAPVTFNGINVAGLGDGTLTVSVISTDLAGNVSTVRTATFTKDTVAPGAPTAVYTDNNNVADVVSGAAQANASVTVTKTAPAPTTAYPTSADGAGAYTVTVAAVNGKSQSGDQRHLHGHGDRRRGQHERRRRP